MGKSISRALSVIHVCVLSNFLLLASVASGETDLDGFVGSDTCTACHQQEHESWQSSDHAKAMSVASAESVLGDFTTTFESQGRNNKFSVKGENYYVETTTLKGVESFQIKFTFGHYPLQQYLVETQQGRIQALNVAWDSRPLSVDDGTGQRWFDLQAQEDVALDSPLHWQRYLMNWNARCADCHSTNIQKNYDPISDHYETSWSEINVACEACHGPGKKHMEWLAKDETDGSALTSDQTMGLVNASQTLQWRFEEGESIARPIGKISEQQTDMCGGCHSRRSVIGEIEAGKAYADQYQISLIDPPLYHLDGQIRDEVFVLGSFMQSKMAQKGVTCGNCHDPHSGKTLAQDNALCAQCHRPAVFDTPEHHHHELASAGAKCVECHMPSTTYMTVDDRRDHQFGIPNPVASDKFDVPNACNSCHADESIQWAMQALTNWKQIRPAEPFLSVQYAISRSDPLVTRDLVELLGSDLPTLKQVSLLASLARFPSKVGLEKAASTLQDSDPLLRRGAVDAIASAPPEIRWKLLSRIADDPILAVRLSVARAVSDLQATIPLSDVSIFLELMNEYRSVLARSADMPSTQTEIGNLELSLGNIKGAEQAYLRAINLEPDLIVALLNLADFYRSIEESEKGLPYLKNALRFAPESGAVNHAYGLYLIRARQYEPALSYLLTATQASDSQPRFSYVYAVALESLGDLRGAINYLEKANEQWPNQFELLMTHILFLEKANDLENIFVPLSRLSKLAPNSPEVVSRINKYVHRKEN
ncbi:MAG: ammonia-forming cytochrome c nitrite reductase subunit c552 [Pseudomonadales bacterium]|nr:ammonia-forming cytochrome c nitrite reductase subunit c552 [Pseudomonadales bacterium]MDG1443823.1 ammonia-forming cytochrome c nitrite reductase subunit c552 [Pseudomonadales bacterium]